MSCSLVFSFLLVPTAQGTPGMAPPPAPATASASAGTTNTATTAGPAPGGPAQPPPPQPSASDLQFSQLLGNLLGPAGPGAGGPGMTSPTITVAMPGVPAFLQGMTDFLQVSGWRPHFTLPLPEPTCALLFCCHLYHHWEGTRELTDAEPSVLFTCVLFKAASVAYGASQARGQIGAAAASLHRSSRQHQTLNPLSKARDRTRVLMDASRIRFCSATMGNPRTLCFGDEEREA